MFKVKRLTLALLAICALVLSQRTWSAEIEDAVELMTSFELKQKARDSAILQAQIKSFEWLKERTAESKSIALAYLFIAEKASSEMLLAKSYLQHAEIENSSFN